jgi:hypothetical protein
MNGNDAVFPEILKYAFVAADWGTQPEQEPECNTCTIGYLTLNSLLWSQTTFFGTIWFTYANFTI